MLLYPTHRIPLPNFKPYWIHVELLSTAKRVAVGPLLAYIIPLLSHFLNLSLESFDFLFIFLRLFAKLLVFLLSFGQILFSGSDGVAKLLPLFLAFGRLLSVLAGAGSQFGNRRSESSYLLLIFLCLSVKSSVPLPRTSQLPIPVEDLSLPFLQLSLVTECYNISPADLILKFGDPLFVFGHLLVEFHVFKLGMGPRRMSGLDRLLK
ncbi:hypothetical protein PG984_008980 [Apiospora sp. TS-2023a]